MVFLVESADENQNQNLEGKALKVLTFFPKVFLCFIMLIKNLYAFS